MDSYYTSVQHNEKKKKVFQKFNQLMSWKQKTENIQQCGLRGVKNKLKISWKKQNKWMSNVWIHQMETIQHQSSTLF